MIPVVVCIDVEPDPREPDPGTTAPWKGWEETLACFTALRPRLQALTGRPARFNWFLRIDPQIALLHGSAGYIAARDRAHFEALAAAGDTLGLHPHLFRRNDADTAWFIDFADWPWIQDVLRGACTTFRETLGRAPDGVRIGDGWMSNAAMALLASLGIRYELTLEPGRRQASWEGALPTACGEFPRIERAPRRPYRPARRDYRRRGRLFPRPLWVIPLSTAPKGAPGGATDYEVLNLVVPWGAADIDTVLGESAAPYLALVLRAGDLAEPRWRAGFAANLEALLGHRHAADLAFVTPSELVARYRRGR